MLEADLSLKLTPRKPLSLSKDIKQRRRDNSVNLDVDRILTWDGHVTLGPFCCVFKLAVSHIMVSFFFLSFFLFCLGGQTRGRERGGNKY